MKGMLRALGSNIAANRERAGLSHSQLGDSVGIKGGTIKNYELGTGGKIAIKDLANIADTLGKSISDLLPASCDVCDVTDLELDNVETSHTYEFATEESKYTVVSMRDSTPGSNDRFHTTCFDEDGNELADGALTGILRSKMLEVVRGLKQQKSSHNRRENSYSART